MNGNALFFDSRRHAEALALLASGHLGRGEYAAAFQYADRRCRLPAASARDYLLRAEVSRRAGFPEEGARDLARALEIDPTDSLVRSVALVRGSDDQKAAVARALIDDESADADALRAAAVHLLDRGAALLHGLRRDRSSEAGRDLVSGWIAWTGDTGPVLRLDVNPRREWRLAADPKHVFTAPGRGGIHITLDACGQRLSLWLGGVEVAALEPPAAEAPALPSQRRGAADLTVIVPVYEDLDATRACLEAVFEQGPDFSARLIVIDDASPNDRLRDWLVAQAPLRRFELLRNARNLGFAATVNRALSLCPHGDVILLNADTLPPPGSLARLAAIARATPAVGTATPLSNNGELTSFPAPHVANPLESPSEVARLDAFAQRANGAACIDMPNGIGFCLFISRACLDAVGPLPEIYARGYYEDVEFCLRAQEKGFRNVCAAGVYVGHAGSLSFGAEKRALVMRNLAVLESRFPEHTQEAQAFVHADPPRAERGAIEALAPPKGECVLLVCGDGASGQLAQDEAKRRAADPDAPQSLFCQFAGDGAAVSLRGFDRAAPQSLQFSLGRTSGEADLRAWLGALRLERIELFDPLSAPPALLDLLFSLERRVELACGDLEWMFSPRLPQRGPCLVAPSASPISASVSASAAPCSSCADNALAPDPDDSAQAERLIRWRALLARVDGVRPLDSMAALFASHVFGAEFVLPTSGAADTEVAPAPVSGGGALALVVPAPCARADRLIVALGRALLRRGSQVRLVVFGACADDYAVMGPGNVFVAGRVESDEYGRLLRQYEISALMSPYRTRFFGRLEGLAAASRLPKACFDWSFGKMPGNADDLMLDPRLCDDRAADCAADWLLARIAGAGAP